MLKESVSSHLHSSPFLLTLHPSLLKGLEAASFPPHPHYTSYWYLSSSSLGLQQESAYAGYLLFSNHVHLPRKQARDPSCPSLHAVVPIKLMAKDCQFCQLEWQRRKQEKMLYNWRLVDFTEAFHYATIPIYVCFHSVPLMVSFKKNGY